MVELSKVDRIRIGEAVRTLCAQRVARRSGEDHRPSGEVNPDEAVGLAMALYDTAASFGVNRHLVDAVVDVPEAVVTALALRASADQC